MITSLASVHATQFFKGSQDLICRWGLLRRCIEGAKYRGNRH
jgi:hypothetical protein